MPEFLEWIVIICVLVLFMIVLCLIFGMLGLGGVAMLGLVIA